jgi:hypothetical protein
MSLGQPIMYIDLYTEEKCSRKRTDYTTKNTSKRINNRTVECVSRDSPKLTGLTEIKNREVYE